MKKLNKKKKVENELFFYVSLSANEGGCGTNSQGCSKIVQTTNGDGWVSTQYVSRPMSAKTSCSP